MGCYPRGTTTPCPVHHHPCGGDWLDRLRSRCSGGAPPPCPMAPPPLERCPPGHGRKELELRIAAEGAVCTAIGGMVHCQGHRHLVRWHCHIIPESGENCLGHRRCGGGVPPFFSRGLVFLGVGWVVTATPGAVPPPPYPVTMASQTSR